MKAMKLIALPVLATALVMTGCASRKPAADVQAGQNPNGSTTVNTSGLSEDAALNAQNLAGASSKGVTEANKAFLAKRVVHFDYDSTELSNEDLQTLQAHAQFLVANANSRVALTGHTDERGTREYNQTVFNLYRDFIFIMNNDGMKKCLTFFSLHKQRLLYIRQNFF